MVGSWWDHVTDKGPAFGYHANSSKSWLVVKVEHLPRLRVSLQRQVYIYIHITCTGRRHCGAVLGTTEFVEESTMERVAAWKTELERLSLIARSELHAVFSVFTHGLTGLWMYFLRTAEGISPLMQPLEDIICQQFLSALTGRDSSSDVERELLALPARHEGRELVNPTAMRRSTPSHCKSQKH